MCPATSFPPSPQLPLRSPRQLPEPTVWSLGAGRFFLSESQVQVQMGLRLSSLSCVPRCGDQPEARARSYSVWRRQGPSPWTQPLSLGRWTRSPVCRGLSCSQRPGSDPLSAGRGQEVVWQGGSRCRTTSASSPATGPAFHHHTWETNTLQLNPQDSIQGMLPESAWPRAWLCPGCLSHLGGGSGLPTGGKMRSEQWRLQGETRGAGRARQERWGQEGCRPQVSPNSGGVSLRLCLCGRGWWINGVSEACLPGRRGSWRGGPGFQRGHPDGSQGPFVVPALLSCSCYRPS